MFHMVTVCGVCDTAIEGEDYDNRHWDNNGVDEYHAQCCPDCVYCEELDEAMRNSYGWDRILDEIMNKEAN